MKYISRIDSGATHCWIVRIMMNKPTQIYKTFSDGRYLVGDDKEQAKKDSYFAALRFKNKILKKHKALMQKYRKDYISNNKKPSYDKLKRPPLFKTGGFKLRKRINKNNTIYYHYNLTVHNKYLGTIAYKAIGVKSSGGKAKALKLAKQWVKKQRNLVLKEARHRGIEC